MFVCVECGFRSKIVRQLQNDNAPGAPKQALNYCLERCKKCDETADKYVEYDNNLKILSVLLCFTQIYRHIFFNVDSVKNIRIKCFLISVSLLFLQYLHESKVNYRNYLEEQFILEVKEIRDYYQKTGHIPNFQSLNVTECEFAEGQDSQCLDLFQLNQILQEALMKIDEEKLYTKHIFDRFDLDALITTVVRKGSYLVIIIALTYIFKHF